MGDQNKPFRFLTSEEFDALPVKERAVYLTLAAQEIETRQRTLREQMLKFVKEEAAKA